MLVKHLIRELEKFDAEAEVYTEGCDCSGDTYAVELDADGTVLIQRSDGKNDDYDNKADTPVPA